MTSRVDASGAIADRAVLRTVGLDDWSTVRHLHATAFERLAGPMLDQEVVRALKAHMTTAQYTEALQRESLWAATLDGLLVGTSGWLPSDDTGHSARITSVFVNPMFLRLGIGRLLVRNAEARARAAGFSSFTARAPEAAAAFFAALGYEVTSHGVSQRLGGQAVPVTFMRRGDPARPLPVLPSSAGRDVESAELVAPTTSERLVLTDPQR